MPAGTSPGCLPPLGGTNMQLLTGDSPLPASLPLSSPTLAPGGGTPDMVYFGTSRPLVRLPAMRSSLPALLCTAFTQSPLRGLSPKQSCRCRLSDNLLVSKSLALRLSFVNSSSRILQLLFCRLRCWHRPACRPQPP